jgi:hypothetical protein
LTIRLQTAVRSKQRESILRHELCPISSDKYAALPGQEAFNQADFSAAATKRADRLRSKDATKFQANLAGR